jgi:sulfur carrier protein ThiS
MESLNANLHLENAVDEDIFVVEVNDSIVPTLDLGKYPCRVTVFCTLMQLIALRKEIERAFESSLVHSKLLARRSGDR